MKSVLALVTRACWCCGGWGETDAKGRKSLRRHKNVVTKLGTATLLFWERRKRERQSGKLFG